MAKNKIKKLCLNLKFKLSQLKRRKVSDSICRTQKNKIKAELKKVKTKRTASSQAKQ